MPKILLLSIFILLNFSFSLFAQNNSFSPLYNECINNGGVVERSGCISDEFKRQDDRLNMIYKEIMQLETEDRKQMLRSAQRSWIKYKEEWNNYLNNISDNDLVINEIIDYTNLLITAQQADNLQQALDGLLYLKNNE
jgi:uncharacterized protein YecT (DUF1311 family)